MKSRVFLAFAFLSSVHAPAGAQDVLPRPEPPFAGKIGRITKDSVKDVPKGVEAPKGAPNILVILTDDAGFGAASTFGGPIPSGRFAGYSLYLLEGKPVFCYNLAGVARCFVSGGENLTPGAHTIVHDYKHDGGLGKGGTGTIEVDGKVAGTGRIDRTLAFRLSLDETLDRGEDTAPPSARTVIYPSSSPANSSRP